MHCGWAGVCLQKKIARNCSWRWRARSRRCRPADAVVLWQDLLPQLIHRPPRYLLEDLGPLFPLALALPGEPPAQVAQALIRALQAFPQAWE
jgi:hypothetical protein